MVASLVAQLVKNLPAMWETWVGKIPWRRERLPTPVFWPREFHGLYSPWGHKGWDTTEQLSLSLSLIPQSVKNLPTMQGSGRSSGEGNGNPLQYSCLKNLMDRGAWWATVHGVARV